MFINQNKQKQDEIGQNSIVPPSQGKNKKSFLNNLYNIKTVVTIVLIIILGASAFFYFTFPRKKQEVKPTTPLVDQPTDNQEIDGKLPGASGTSIKNSEDGGNRPTDIIKAEDLTFGYFYKKEKDEEDFVVKQTDIGLPINVKSDVSNYYYISRRIDLDDKINQLNNNGFAVLSNPFTRQAPLDTKSYSNEQADDFYSMYNLLSKKEIPILITSDFLIYYYQNTLKQVFKDIEGEVFYKDIWQINKNFYEVANSKYRELHKEFGMINDPILEGQRLEAAYFAVTLELLKPKLNQITQEVYSNTKFTKHEAAKFEFNLPVYLQEDVKREINLIMEAERVVKSPVFLYSRDYKEFKIPNEYKNNAKLHNYFLATRWMNSVFPLYYKNDSCESCLLDKDDWLISMIAACLIAKDFSDNQDLKNQWAKVYKIISFFSGLRRDLTYLHYQDALIDVFGHNYKINDIFSTVNPNRDDDLLKLQKRIAKYEFSEIEGGLNRIDISTKALLGMRMLQGFYWPNDYIFSQLTSPNVTLYLDNITGPDYDFSLTYCRNQKSFPRCKGFGLDIINLIYPIPESNSYFKENTNYQNYYDQVAILKNQLADFNVDSWHNNNFWTTLSIAKSFLGSTSPARPIFISNNNWREKNLNTVLGAWVNLQLPADKLSSRLQKEGNNLGIITTNSDYDYVEPDLVLVSELIANTKMLSQMLISLGVIKDLDFTYVKLSKLIKELENIKEIIKKELNNKVLDYNNLQTISNLTKQFIVLRSGEKSIELKFKHSNATVTESIKGVKLLIIVYNWNDKKVFAIGPIFNYQEK